MKYLTLFFVFSCALFVNAQENTLSDYLLFENQILFTNAPVNIDKFVYANNNISNEIIISFYHVNNQTDSIFFYVYNTEIDSLYIESYYIKNINKSIKNDYSKTFTGIAVSDMFIGVLTSEYVYLLSRKDKNLIYKLKDKHKYDFTNIDFIGKNIFLSRNYNFHDKTQKNKTRFYLFTIPDFSLLTEISPSFDYILYSHISPNHWISVNNNKILFSNTVNYKIIIYNNNFEILDTILLSKENEWNSPTIDDISKIQEKKEAISIIYEIGKYENDKERIVGVYWISDSVFLVKVNRGHGESIENLSYDTYFDIWKLKENNWNLEKFHIKDKKLSDVLLEKNEFSFFNCSNIIFTNKNVFLLTFRSPTLLKNISTEEYIKQSNDYFYDNNPIFQIIKYKHSFE